MKRGITLPHGKRQKIETVLGKRTYDVFVSGMTQDDIMEQRYYPYLYF
jgi:hypothetical protein